MFSGAQKNIKDRPNAVEVPSRLIQRDGLELATGLRHDASMPCQHVTAIKSDTTRWLKSSAVKSERLKPSVGPRCGSSSGVQRLGDMTTDGSNAFLLVAVSHQE